MIVHKILIIAIRILSDTNKSMKPYNDIAYTAEKSAMRMVNR